MKVFDYSVTTITKEEKQFVVENEKHCFLKGKAQYNDGSSYLGVWIDGYENLKYVIISSSKQNKIIFQSLPNMDECKTVNDSIEDFLQSTTDVVKISEDEFFEELSERIDMLGR